MGNDEGFLVGIALGVLTALQVGLRRKFGDLERQLKKLAAEVRTAAPAALEPASAAPARTAAAAVKYWAALAILAAAPLLAAAGAPPTLDDFVKALRLDIDPGQPLYRLRLTEEVYRQVTRPDLGDIRVFGRDGQTVRHRLIERRRHAPEVAPRWVGAPHFPVPAQGFEPGGELRIKIQHNGALVQIDQDGAAQDAMTDPSYIVDLSRLSQTVRKIDLVFAEAAPDFSVAVEVAGSPDLDHWTTVVPRATVMSLRYEGHLLRRTVVELDDKRWPYLRLRWLEHAAAPALRGVKASVIGSAQPVQGVERITVTGTIAGRDGHVVEFDLGGCFPLIRASLDLVPTSAVNARFGSRDTPQANWRIHQSGVFYAMRQDQTVVRSGPVSTGFNSDRYWILEDVANARMRTPLPQLNVEWVPHDLVFLDEGTPPYVLAFGSGRVGAPDQSIASLLKSIAEKQSRGMVGEARVAGVVPAGGQSRRQVPSAPLPWQRIVLWAILLGGVLIVAVMAWRLVRQLNAVPPGRDDADVDMD